MNDKRYVLSVGALVWNEAGRLLLLRRASSSKHFAGEWEPPGGKALTGEEAGMTVLREVREETGLEVELDAVAGAVEFELPLLRVAVLYFHAHADTGIPRVSAEHEDLRWVNPAEINSMNLTEPFNRLVCQHNPLMRPNDDGKAGIAQPK
jgi:8-oxo-dGTP diphosphatase